MGIRDWLFERKRGKDTTEQFEQMMKEHDSVPLKEGRVSQNGIACPHCGRVLSLIEDLAQRGPGAFQVKECPGCHMDFKTH